MKNWLKKILFGFICLFAAIGFVLVVGFFALRFGLTKTAGLSDLNDRYFENFFKKQEDISSKGEQLDYCKLVVISKLYPATGRGLLEIINQPNYGPVLVKAIAAQEIYLAQDDRYQRGLEVCRQTFGGENLETSYLSAWQRLPEWQTLREAIIKDQAAINKAAAQAGVDSRLLVSILTVEQLRLFTSEREVYKQIFQPLKILGTQSKFSWGVMGMKEETAIQVENNLRDKNSVFYLGQKFENLLAFSENDESAERFTRLTDQHDHYYSYLYSALFLKQIMLQWQRASYDILSRPEILATLFNLGFDKSLPKSNPEAGGAEIEIEGASFSFGGLAFQFYYSGELAEFFPLTN